MKTILGGILCFAFWAWGSIFIYNTNFSANFTDTDEAAPKQASLGLGLLANSQVSVDESAEPEKKATAQNLREKYGLSVFEEGDRILSSTEMIACAYSSDSLEIGEAVGDLLDTISLLLQHRPKHALLVISRFETNEKQPEAFENIGLSRAESLKSQLVARGSKGASIKLLSQVESDLFSSDANQAPDLFDLVLMAEEEVLQYFSKVESEYHDSDAPDREMKLAVTRSVNFDYGTSRIKTDKLTDDYFETLKEYLNKNQHKYVEITGHTCNVSSSGFNHKLGFERAQSVRKLLVSKGISAERIKASSAGESRPIADNSSTTGKQANRRVEIVIH